MTTGAPPSTTEDVPATPGWVDSELEQIFAALPEAASLSAERDRYADCLAASRTGDVDAAHDRCRRALMVALEERGVATQAREALDKRLEALEAEISART